MACEKQQVGALGEHLAGVLADLPVASDRPDDLELRTPVEAAFRVGPISLGWDETADRVVILIEEAVAEEEDGARVRVRITRGQAAAFVERAAELVEAGRPPCPLCGFPRGPEHICPRSNGHGPPT